MEKQTLFLPTLFQSDVIATIQLPILKAISMEFLFLKRQLQLFILCKEAVNHLHSILDSNALHLEIGDHSLKWSQKLVSRTNKELMLTTLNPESNPPQQYAPPFCLNIQMFGLKQTMPVQKNLSLTIYSFLAAAAARA